MKTTIVAMLALTISGPAFAQDWKKDYPVIRIGVSSNENEVDRMARYKPWQDYLEKALGVRVELFTAGSYDGIVQALASDQIEAATIGSSAYAAAYTETKGGVIPLLAEQDNKGSTGYYSIVAVRCDAGYKGIDDLKGKVLAFADPDSTSGYAVPSYNLVKQGKDPKAFFSNIVFAGSHEAGIMGVRNRQFDAATTSVRDLEGRDGTPQRMVAKGMIKHGEICPVWTSPEITNSPLTVRANLPKSLIDAIREAYKKGPQDAPAAFKSITGGVTSNAVGYVEVNHEHYQWIVDMRGWLKRQRRS